VTVTDAANCPMENGERRNDPGERRAAIEEYLTRQRPALRRAYEARRSGRSCGACGGPLPAEVTEPVWMAKVGRFLIPSYHFQGPRVVDEIAPACRDCAPPELVAREPRAVPCDGCGRPLVWPWPVKALSRHWCSDRCRQAFYDRRRRRRREAGWAREEKVCPVCGEAFDATRRDAVTCRPACRQKAYRARKREG
jgi:hypothetical protein